MLSLFKSLTVITAAGVLCACSSQPASGPAAGSESHVIIGANKGPTTILTYSPTTLKFTGQTQTDNTNAHYVRVNGDTLYSLHPNKLTASALSLNGAEITPIASAQAGRGATAVETSADGAMVFTAHFPDKRLTARRFDGETFSAPQDFPCSEAHQFRVHPSGKFAYAGCRDDILRQFTVNQAAGTVTPITPPIVTVPGGPRHLDFHPSGDALYLLLEHSSEVAVFDIDVATGAVKQPPKQVIATTTDGAMNRSSDIHVAPDGRRVYAFNRVNQDMAFFDVKPDRSLTQAGIVPMGFGEVRDWAMSPGGDYIITATNKGHVGLWSVNPDTGYLTLSDARTDLGNAITVAIVE